MAERSRDREVPDSRARAAQGRSGEGGAREAKGKPTSPWEWAVAATGALLVLGATGVMLFEAANHAGTPPDLEVLVDSIVATDHGYLVQVRVRNHGTATAAALLLEGELRTDSGTAEKSQATISYAPGMATRSGGILFTRDPRRYTLDIRALGYDTP